MYKPMTSLLAVITILIVTSSVTTAQEARKGFGTELDALPYITGGYYASLWYGHHEWRFRGVVSRINLPEFVTEDGFEDAKTTAYAVIVDRFFGNRAASQEGLWLGGGFEYWRNRISREGNPTSAKYESSIATAGAGYVIPLGKRFFINPWLAGHYRFSGEDEVEVAGATYRPKKFLFELSIKLGIRF